MFFQQIYTITVLNGSTQHWLRKDSIEPSSNPTLDLDNILGGFPNYVKNECFNYEDSGFATDSKDNILSPTQPNPPQLQVNNGPSQVTTSNIMLGNGGNHTGQSNGSDIRHVIAFQNNNNDWQMEDHNGDQVGFV